MSTDSVASRMRGLVEADPVVLLEIAGAIADDGKRWPGDAVTALAAEHAPRLADADPSSIRKDRHWVCSRARPGAGPYYRTPVATGRA